MTQRLTTALAIARWAGSAQWVTVRLAESVGAWLPTLDDSALRLMMGRHCGTLGSHAAQWFSRIPTRRDVDIDAVNAPADPQVASCVTAIAGLTGDAARATALYSIVIPAMISNLDAALSMLRSDIDGPSVRLCTVVRSDLDAMRNEALRELGSLCNDAQTHKKLADLLPTSFFA